MEFKKYPSISQMDRKLTHGYIIELGYDQLPWQVGLKIHGANFNVSMTSDKDSDMRFGRKLDFITEGEGFYRYEEAVEKYRENFKKFYNFLKRYHTFDQLTLYFELFGGSYNHPEVKRHPHASRVMKGVNYCPHNDLYLFDIKLDNMFMNKTFVSIAVNGFGFIGNRPLFQGSYRECMEYPNEFLDPIYKLFGLPAIDDNTCEGVIVEPETPKFFGNGDRVILKNLGPRFKEKSRQRKVTKVKEPHEWSEEGLREIEVIVMYITDNRLRNILSHFGRVKDNDFGKILGMFSKDTLEDYMKDQEESFESLSTKEQKLLKKHSQMQCSQLLKSNIVDIIDNEF